MSKRVAMAVALALVAAVVLLIAQQAATPVPGPVAVSGPVLERAQGRVDPAHSYHRIIAVVPMVGSGTQEDPVRPMFSPAASAASNRNDIIGWQAQVSDDGKSAIVEFVAASRSALAPLLASTNPQVKVFEVGKNTSAEIEAAARQVKPSFVANAFRPLPVQ